MDMHWYHKITQTCINKTGKFTDWSGCEKLLNYWKNCVIKALLVGNLMGSAGLLIISWSCGFLSITSMPCLIYLVITMQAFRYSGDTAGIFASWLYATFISWVYAKFWIAGILFILGGYVFLSNFSPLLGLLANAWALYCVKVQVGWLGVFFSINSAFLMNDMLQYVLQRCDKPSENIYFDYVENTGFEEQKESKPFTKIHSFEESEYQFSFVDSEINSSNKPKENIFSSENNLFRDTKEHQRNYPLKVSLEDLYNGKSKKLSFSRNVICVKCKGKGSRSGVSMKCAGCQGSGMKATIMHLGPSMIQKMQHLCNECKGTGESISDKDRCPQCKGDKVAGEKKVLEVHAEKGMQNGQKLTFPGEADEAPDTVTGDIVFVLQQKEHPKFKRKGDDLFVEHTLSLTEALCGFQFILTHLDNRQLLIKSQPGEVVKPDSFKAINDEGMPMYQRPFMKGKLYIHFTVEFPDSLSPDQSKSLEAVLPPKTSAQISEMELDKCEETTLHEVNIEEEMRRKQLQAQQEAYDEDEDMHPYGAAGAQRVECAQQ